MTQSLADIKKQNIIVTTLRRDNKEILLCRDKVSAAYKFFWIEGEDKYTNVDAKTDEKLRRLFPSGMPTEFFMDSPFKSGDETDQDIEKAVEKTKRIITRCVDERLGRHPLPVKNACEKNRKTLKITPALGKGGYGHGASYIPSKHEVNIFVFDKNLFEMAYLVLHETYHGISRNPNDQSSSGIIKVIGLQTKNSNTESINIIGLGLNEAITDYLAVKDITNFLEKQDYISPQAQEFLSHYSYSAYDFITNVFINVFNKVDMDRALNYYFTNDLEGLLDYMKEQYHYKDHDTILSLIYKMDAFVSLLNNATETAQLDDFSTLIQGLYIDTFQLIVHKYMAEGKDISQIPFDQIFTDERLPVDGAEKAEFVETLRLVYNRIATGKIDIINKHNLNDDAFRHTAFLELASKRDPFRLPEDELNAEFVLRAFSSSIHIFSSNSDSPVEEAIEKKRVAFEFIFGDKCNCFETQKQKITIISELIRNNNQIPFRFMQYFKPSDIAEALQNDNNLAPIVAKVDFPVFMSCMPVLGDKVLSMTQVKLEIAASCLYMKKQNKDYKTILEYYKYSFTSKLLAQKNLDDILKVIEKYEDYEQQNEQDPQTPDTGDSANIE